MCPNSIPDAKCLQSCRNILAVSSQGMIGGIVESLLGQVNTDLRTFFAGFRFCMTEAQDALFITRT